MIVEDLILKLRDSKSRIGPNATVRFYLTTSPETGREGIMPYDIYEVIVSESEETVFILGYRRKDYPA